MAGVRLSWTSLQLSKKTPWDFKMLQRSAGLSRSFMTPSSACALTIASEKSKVFEVNLRQLSTSRARCSTAPALVADIDGAASLSPAVKYLVNTNSISDLSLITPSGPKSRILKGDVLRYLDDIKAGHLPSRPSPSSTSPIATPTLQSPHPPSSVPVVKVDSKTSSPIGGKDVSYVDILLDEVQRSRAEQLVQSKLSTPHMYTTATCDVQRLIDVAKVRADETGQNSSNMLAFLVKAAALTLQRLPECNARWTSNDIPLSLSSVDMSVTVDSTGGPATTHLRDAHRLSTHDIGQALQAAIQGSPPPDAQSETFSLIYLGDSGVTEFTSVLGPNQSAVLSIGSVKTQPSPGDALGGKRSSTVTVTLTTDARVYRDDLAGQWLEEFRRTVEIPELYGLL